ncbi:MULTISPECIES: restriction endonuclease subunit S [Staphylococcus]|uniref:restriction endonuclease subunit S n=1 Tax=Staphylococcus TaxID=1279 RepID=UPI0014773ABF|nr:MULTISPECIES: restriction endonuclease subunit S [Staphylococcus]QJR33973.1 restriction endonuclease subunit S [Staphylococcus aureus]WEK94470.1 restriction endonuclease subunit S [Staphylococcus aureus]
MTNELKNVPELRFPEFEGEWENSKLGTVANVYDGTHQTPKYTSEGIKFLSVENIKTLNSNKFISKEAFEKEFKIRPEFGDVLMTRIGDVGTPNVVETNEYLAYYVSLALLKPKKLNSYFLESLIRSQSVQNELWRKTLHIAFPKKINKNEIAKVEINYPEQQEQQKIGEFFSKLDRQIELEEQKLAKLEEQKKGYMQKIFSQELRFKDENGNDYPEWEIKKLMQIAKVKTGSKNVQDNIQDGKFKFFDRSVEVKYLNTFDFDETAIIYPGEGSKFLPRYFSGKYSLHQRAYSIYDININNNYLYYYLSLQNNHFLKYAVGSTVKSLRMSGFDKLKVMVPKNSEQEKIGDFFNELDELIEKQSSKIGVLKQRKKGFLQKMFV